MYNNTNFNHMTILLSCGVSTADMIESTVNNHVMIINNLSTYSFLTLVSCMKYIYHTTTKDFINFF